VDSSAHAPSVAAPAAPYGHLWQKKGVQAMRKIMQISVDQALLDRIEAYQKRQRIVPSRVESVRTLLDIALRMEERDAA
jgi:hypothetical protein